MLMLSLNPGRKVIIRPSANLDLNMTIGELFNNNTIEILFCEKKQSKGIKVGISAPVELNIVREEIQHRNEKEPQNQHLKAV